MMKRTVGVFLVLCSLLLTAMPVAARSASGQDTQRVLPQASRDATRSAPRRTASASERKQRLSQEERRALRRDIKDAGRQIYRPRTKQAPAS